MYRVQEKDEEKIAKEEAEITIWINGAEPSGQQRQQGVPLPVRFDWKGRAWKRKK